MNDRSFLDTNILVYTDDHDSPEKQTRALQLFAELRQSGTGVVSTQVLQEYFVTVTRKLKVNTEIARRKVEIFARLILIPIDLNLILTAIDLQQQHQLSFWDALIVKAAVRGGCTKMFTEDLQHQQYLEGIRIVNPFLK